MSSVSASGEAGAGVSAQVAPQNVCAEEAVLGGIHLTGVLSREGRVDECREVGLEPGCFYRRSHGLIYEACLALEERGVPPAPLLVNEELRARGTLDDVGGEKRIHLLLASAYADANYAHYAGLVVSAERRRRELACARRLELASQNGGLDIDRGLREELQAMIDAPGGAGRSAALEGLDLDEFLSGPAPRVDWLWQGRIGRGDLALLVGDPGVGKSLLSLALADGVRRGTALLGKGCQPGRAGVIDFENPCSE